MGDSAAAPSLALGSASPIRRGAHVVLVSLYLVVTWLILVATAKLRVRPVAFACKALRRMRGRDAQTAQAVSPTPAVSPAVSDSPATPDARGLAPVAARTSGAFLLTDWIDVFRCPRCRGRLTGVAEAWVCANQHRFAVVRDVPRFVPDDAYVRSFSREWNTHDTTQLDSRRQAPISDETLRAKTGLGPGDVAGRLVLDAGVGSGRFSEVLCQWGARVVGVDLSLAVEAARRNLAGEAAACVVQADIGDLPFAPATFDVVVSIGVLHHTPDTRRAFEALVPLLKPGGTIAIWVYPDEASYATRAVWIPFTSRIPPDAFYDWCRWFVALTHRVGESRATRLLWNAFPYSRQGLGIDWDVLDTFDGFSPRYHGVHTPDEVERWFRAAGLVDVRESSPIHTSVRGRRPG